MASYIRSRGSTLQSDEAMDDDNDEKDDTKRKSRNLSEKKRRDQFNMLVNELGSMVSTNTRKMDKSTVLKSTILFLKNHNELTVKSRAHEIQEDWKPSFLSNEEFTHLTLEALDGFIMVFSSAGRIFYASESITSLLGYLPSELMNSTIYEIAFQEDQSHLYGILANARDQTSIKKEQQNVSFTCHVKRGGLDFREEPIYELVQFIGYFRTEEETDNDSTISNNRFDNSITEESNKTVFVCTGRLKIPQLIKEMSVVDNTKTEFTSRHSLEWKFLFLDHRAPPIIGYLPFEVLGTSGYDYYHIDDLDKVVTCHESLMKKGEGTSCHYRFLTKGQQWIWLQTRFYITYNQWNSKPEFIVCTHRVVNYVDVIKQTRRDVNELSNLNAQDDALSSKNQTNNVRTTATSSSWSAKSSKNSSSMTMRSRLRQGEESGTTSSTYSQSSRSFQSNQLSSISKKKNNSTTSPKTMMTCDDDGTTSKPSQQQQDQVTQSAYQSQTQEISPKMKVEIQQHQQQQDQSQQHCPDFLDQTQYAVVPMETVVGGAFTGEADTSMILPLQATEQILQQQGLINLTPAQNQIQDELQRKHEELQQLIVHQQEELRRVSEQLLIARYGIFSPLLNVSVPFNSNSSHQTTRCVPTTPHQTMPGVSVFEVPITVPVNIVSPELFPHTLPVNSVLGASVPSHGNVIQMMPQQQQQIQQLGQQQQQMDQQQQQEQSTTDLMTFQMCQPNDLLYTNMDAITSQQQRPDRN